MHVLVIHPNPELCGHLLPLMRRYNASASCAASLVEACALLRSIHPQLIIAARSLLTGDASALFGAVDRSEPPPILFLTNVQSPADLAGPERTRIEAMLAYLSGLSVRGAEPIQVGQLYIDPAHKRARLGDQWVTLPPLQFHLLSYLAEHAGEVVGYRELLRAVWGYDEDEEEARALLKVHIRQLRRRLGLVAHTGEYLRAVRGFGYILEAPSHS